MYSIKQQQGMTFWGWLVILSILGIAVLVGVKLAPKYLDFYSVKSLLDQVAQQDFDGTPKKREVWSSISKHLDVNYIEYIKQEHLAVKQQKDGTHLILDYEVREPIMGNVDVVLSFKHSATVKK